MKRKEFIDKNKNKRQILMAVINKKKKLNSFVAFCNHFAIFVSVDVSMPTSVRWTVIFFIPSAFNAVLLKVMVVMDGNDVRTSCDLFVCCSRIDIWFWLHETFVNCTNFSSRQTHCLREKSHYRRYSKNE